MGLLRSETMKKGTLVVPNERARKVIHELGSRTRIQLEDMNAASMRRVYKTAVQRIEECERIVRVLSDQIEQHEGSDVTGHTALRKNMEEFLQSRPGYKFEEVEAELKRAYSQLQSARDNHRGIVEQHARTLEEKYVVHVAKSQLAYDDPTSSRGSIRGLLAAEMADAGTVGFFNLAGVIGRSEQDRLARALFRMSRGNTFTSFHPIAEPIEDENGKPTLRSVFVVYFQGGANTVMAEKVKNICTAYGGHLYQWQNNIADAEKRFQELNDSLEEGKGTQDAYQRFLNTEFATLISSPRANGNSLLEDYRMHLVIEKSIYASLNLFESSGSTLRCDCWYAEAEESMIAQTLLSECPDREPSALLIPTRAYYHAVDPHSGGQNPPTYIKSFGPMWIAQEIVNTYGTPEYKEANPMILSLVTFPFIFGVMFGDIGHGLLLLLAGVYLVLKGKSLVSEYGPEYGKYMYEGRWLLLMMGFFAFYCGFLYNDFVGIGIDLFGSRYVEGEESAGGKGVEWVPNFDATNTGVGAGPYPFGVDPAWHGATNQLLFVNSMKMKCAVLIGVAQMVIGTLMSFSNAVNNRSKVDFMFVCVPQLVFMCLFFGYMDYLILYKWTHKGNSPSIINSMIAMGLMQPLSADQELWPGQQEFQAANLLILGLCVPALLIPKPLCLYMTHKVSPAGYGAVAGQDDDEAGHGHGGKQATESHFDMSEIVIHQVIETIEFVLGSISHTASYLRLWALSLAHNQLSIVFLQKTLLAAMAFGGGVSGTLAIFFGTSAFICISMAILMGMDVLECFLHTLRLHWVEFQSKFFKASGTKIEPYNHQTVLENA